MSKVAKAKEVQGFQVKPIHPRCADCKNFSFDVIREKSTWGSAIYVSEKNLRCTLGGFKVGKNSTCNLFERKADA
jgi:hypothetical protein